MQKTPAVDGGRFCWKKKKKKQGLRDGLHDGLRDGPHDGLQWVTRRG
jgi:hypothetical protein